MSAVYRRRQLDYLLWTLNDATHPSELRTEHERQSL